MEDFVRLQRSCDNEMPDRDQWTMMCSALGCAPAEGLMAPALARLYEGEGPYSDYYTLLERGLIAATHNDADGSRAASQLAKATHRAMAASATDRGDSRLLDEQFDEVAKEYADEDIGSLDGGSDDEATRGQFDLSEVRRSARCCAQRVSP